MQLAKTCANNIAEWLELCRSIDCPPTDEECVPGPYHQVGFAEYSTFLVMCTTNIGDYEVKDSLIVSI